ncbi:hypothetical protein [Bacillus pseudomycoides]|uniref:hypothetical protein n=1 Tax=Bacillus pseudomycoides TaxID=64104 RepID=UPI000BFD6C16|nr:hypothetical protein [Bacillus pseudomycoides]PHA95894.1 hypothetical protein COE78_08150 [Bacillus pseudomycoides]
MTQFENAIQRIKDINWDDVKKNQPSFELLVSEFIRRGNIFRDIYSPENKYRLAIFSAAETISAEIQVDIEGIINDLNLLRYGWTARYLCKSFLEWSYLINSNNKIAMQFEDLYEPIIMLYERGDRISYHQNELLCGKYAWLRNCYDLPKNGIIKELKHEELDRIDNKGNA